MPQLITPLPRPAAARRRHIHYVDKILQKRLLVALVTLEAGLVAAMVWLTHWRLSQIIEENLYRVHLAKAAPLLNQFMQDAPLLLGVFMLANVIALLLADGIWRGYINSLLRDFMTTVGKTGRLDFSADPQFGSRHRLLELAVTQRARERFRLAAIRDRVAQLEAAVSANASTQEMRILVESLNKHLS